MADKIISFLVVAIIAIIVGWIFYPYVSFQVDLINEPYFTGDMIQTPPSSDMPYGSGCYPATPHNLEIYKRGYRVGGGCGLCECR